MSPERHADPDPYRDVPAVIAILATNLARLTAVAIPALYNLHRSANAHDSYPTTTSGRDAGPHGSGELTRIEAASHHRLGDLNGDPPHNRPGPTVEAWDLYDQTLTARDALVRAVRIAQRNLTIDRLTDAEKRRLYCIEDNPTRCTNFATSGGYCDQHHLERRAKATASQRRWRYRQSGSLHTPQVDA